MLFFGTYLKREEFLTEKMMEQFGERGKKVHLGLECVGEGGRGMMGREKEQRGPREDGVLLTAQSSADGAKGRDSAVVLCAGGRSLGSFPLGLPGARWPSLWVPPSPSPPQGALSYKAFHPAW